MSLGGTAFPLVYRDGVWKEANVSTGKTVVANIQIQLNEDQLREIATDYVRAWLEKQKNGCWLRDGKIYTEGYTSHSFEYALTVGPDGDFKTQAAYDEAKATLEWIARVEWQLATGEFFGPKQKLTQLGKS